MLTVTRLSGVVAAMIMAGAVARADDSPFAPPSDAAGAGAAAQEAYELSGATATPDGTEVCLFNSETKKSNWIAVGSSRDGVEVISFDPDRDQAVVAVKGERKTLALRKPAVTAAPLSQFYTASPVAASAPVVYSSAPTSETISSDPKAAELAKQAREARMLVSDLMEIGLEQRKAYAAEMKRQASLKAAGLSQ